MGPGGQPPVCLGADAWAAAGRVVQQTAAAEARATAGSPPQAIPGAMPAEHFVQQHARREDVHLWAQPTLADHLGRHVGGRACAQGRHRPSQDVTRRQGPATRARDKGPRQPHTRAQQPGRPVCDAAAVAGCSSTEACHGGTASGGRLQARGPGCAHHRCLCRWRSAGPAAAPAQSRPPSPKNRARQRRTDWWMG